MSRIVVKTKGLNSARTLNELSKKGIVVLNAKRIGLELSFEICKKNRKKVKDCLEKMYLPVEFEERKDFFDGIFSVWRFGIAVGLVFCLVLYLSLSSFILKIDISGVDENKKNEVLYFLSENGIKAGTKKEELDLEKLENQILKQFDFSVVSPIFEGTTLVLKLKEELNPPIYIDLSQKTPLVATEDALVTRIVCQSGTKEIEVGCSVKKGQTLISCLKMVGESQHAVRAVGEVYGKVWREKEIFVPETIQTFVPTGREERVYSIKIGNISGVVQKSTFENYECTQTSIRIGDFLPIYRVETIYTEQKEVQKQIEIEDINQMIEKAKKEIFIQNQEMVGEFIRTWTIERNVDGGKIVKVVVEFETRIDKYA